MLDRLRDLAFHTLMGFEPSEMPTRGKGGFRLGATSKLKGKRHDSDMQAMFDSMFLCMSCIICSSLIYSRFGYKIAPNML